MEIIDSFTPAEQRYNAVQRITKSHSRYFEKDADPAVKRTEYHDIVHREVYAQIPPKVEYSITEYGQLMKPVLQTMSNWGVGHMQHMEKLYGEEDEKGAHPSEPRKIDSLGDRVTRES